MCWDRLWGELLCIGWWGVSRKVEEYGWKWRVEVDIVVSGVSVAGGEGEREGKEDCGRWFSVGEG